MFNPSLEDTIQTAKLFAHLNVLTEEQRAKLIPNVLVGTSKNPRLFNLIVELLTPHQLRAATVFLCHEHNSCEPAQSGNVPNTELQELRDVLLALVGYVKTTKDERKKDLFKLDPADSELDTEVVGEAIRRISEWKGQDILQGPSGEGAFLIDTVRGAPTPHER